MNFDVFNLDRTPQKADSESSPSTVIEDTGIM